ncbi:MAG: P-loop NTPase [Chloroflexota bacterium]|nr:P-loop NTPase [Chloroflexota bacterium]
MKVSVCGKGGSGKSTVVTLLANEFKARGCHVLVVDSDESNSGLFRMLGFDHPPVPLMELVGGKRSLKDRMAVGFSSGGSEPKMEVLSTERILLKDISPPHIIERDNLSMISIGKILQSLEGCACPMGVLSREFLKKLHLGANEVAIVDMEAGVEHFGRGVETSIDSVLMVVEPSLESIELAARVKGLAEGAGVEHTWAVLNKIGSQDMALGLEEELGKRGVPVIGHVYYRPEIFEACLKGHKLAGESGGEGIRQVADRLLSG